MQARVEQRGSIKTFFLMGLSQSKIHQNLVAAYGDNALSKTQVRFWFKRFEEDPAASASDRKHTGRPKVRHTKRQQIEEALEVDRRQTLRQLSQVTGVSRMTIQRVLKDAKFAKLAPKMIPHLLTQQQKDFRARISAKLLQEMNRDPTVLQRIVTCDESWVFTFDPRTKQGDMEWTPLKIQGQSSVQD